MMRQSTHWPAVLAVLAAGIVAGMSVSKISPALPLLQSEFGLSLIGTGWLVSMFNTIAVASAIFFGLISDRAGALRFCGIGLACIIAGGVMGTFAPNAAWLVASRVAEGAGFVAVIVAGPSLVVGASTPSQHGLALGLWGTYMPIGGAVSVAASPLLIQSFGWRGVWVSGAVLAATAAALLWLQSRQFPDARSAARAGRTRSVSGIRASLAQPVPWLLSIAFAAYTLQFYTVMIWLPTYLLQTRATDAMTASMLTALFISTNAFGNIMGGWLMHRNLPRGRVMGITFMLTTIAFILMFAGGLPDGLRYACVLAYSFITGTVPPSVISGGARYARSAAEAGSIQGLIVQVSNVGSFAGPPLIAAAVTHAGDWGAALWVILPAAAIGLSMSLAVARYEAAARPARTAR